MDRALFRPRVQALGDQRGPNSGGRNWRMRGVRRESSGVAKRNPVCRSGENRRGAGGGVGQAAGQSHPESPTECCIALLLASSRVE